MKSSTLPGCLVLAAALATAAAGCDRDVVAPYGAPAQGTIGVVAVDSGGGASLVVAADPVRIAAGLGHSCAIRPDGVIECWGSNSDGQAPASKTATSGAFVEVSAGSLHTCALRDDGVVQCWGWNGIGQAPLTRTATTGTFTHVSAGGGHTCARRSDGAIECWGNNGSLQAPATRTAVSGTFTNVHAGADNTCALRSDGAVECWGLNSDGQSPALKQAALGKFIQVSTGAYHSCAVRGNGAVECWGYNSDGQAPALVTPAAGKFVRVAVGLYHGCATRNDGKAECWGYNGYGSAPALLGPAAGRFAQIESYHYHSCAMREDRVVECWGLDDDNQSDPGGAPGTPYGLSATVVGDAQVDLAWSDTVSDEGWFRILRRTWNTGSNKWGPWVQRAETAPNAVSHSDAVAPGRYQYRVQACRFGGCSSASQSNEVTAGVPATPASISAVRNDPGQVTVSWSDSNLETRYELERRDRVAGVWGPFAPLAQPAENAVSHVDATASTPDDYRYRIRACNAAGCSAWITSGVVY